MYPMDRYKLSTVDKVRIATRGGKKLSMCFGVLLIGLCLSSTVAVIFMNTASKFQEESLNLNQKFQQLKNDKQQADHRNKVLTDDKKENLNLVADMKDQILNLEKTVMELRYDKSKLESASWKLTACQNQLDGCDIVARDFESENSNLKLRFDELNQTYAEWMNEQEIAMREDSMKMSLLEETILTLQQQLEKIGKYQTIQVPDDEDPAISSPLYNMGLEDDRYVTEPLKYESTIPSVLINATPDFFVDPTEEITTHPDFEDIKQTDSQSMALPDPTGQLTESTRETTQPIRQVYENDYAVERDAAPFVQTDLPHIAQPDAKPVQSEQAFTAQPVQPDDDMSMEYKQDIARSNNGDVMRPNPALTVQPNQPDIVQPNQDDTIITQSAQTINAASDGSLFQPNKGRMLGANQPGMVQPDDNVNAQSAQTIDGASYTSLLQRNQGPILQLNQRGLVQPVDYVKAQAQNTNTARYGGTAQENEVPIAQPNQPGMVQPFETIIGQSTQYNNRASYDNVDRMVKPNSNRVVEPALDQPDDEITVQADMEEAVTEWATQPALK